MPLLGATCLLPILMAARAIAGGSSLTWTQDFPVISPEARSYLAMTYDAASKKVVVFGGFGGGGYLSDTWTFDGTTWTKVETAVAPSPRANAQMAYDHRTRKVILFGGYDGSADLGDTWLWDGRTYTWTQAAPAHSPKAVTGPMNSADSRAIFMKARCGSGAVQTGEKCTQLPSPTPGHRRQSE